MDGNGAQRSIIIIDDARQQQQEQTRFYCPRNQVCDRFQFNSVCHYNNLGMCRLGDACRFLHLERSVSTDHDDLEFATTMTATTATTTSSINANTDSPNQSQENVERVEDVIPVINSNNVIPIDPSDWVNAPVFVPKQYRAQDDQLLNPVAGGEIGEIDEQIERQAVDEEPIAPSRPKSYAEVVGKKPDIKVLPVEHNGRVLCPFIQNGEANCRFDNASGYGDVCGYDHGDLCDMCSTHCLHPTDPDQRKAHEIECIRQHETDMEISFAVARSMDKTCGVCFEIIMEKSGREQRFGILPNCNHIFCLECIRKWRQAKQFDNKIIRACPECRVTSDFVCPSSYWVDTKEEKDKLLVAYRKALGEKDCKYFKKGHGKCPFGNKCFYKHALPNGMCVDVGMPQRQVRRHNHLGEVDVLQQLFLWDFMDDRDQQWLDDLATILSEDGDDYDSLAYTYVQMDNL